MDFFPVGAVRMNAVLMTGATRACVAGQVAEKTRITMTMTGATSYRST
jgi:hypothetical protein